MKEKVLLCWMVLHLLYIFITNVVGSYALYTDYINEKLKSPPIVKAAKILSTPPLNFYGRYTGAETGYGFFGLNVRSNGLLIGECNNEEITADFNSLESSLRFFSLSSSITDDLLKDRNQENIISGNDKTYEKEYNNLVIKNIAVKLFNDKRCLDSVIRISYNLLDFPTLKEYRKNSRRKYELIQIKKVEFHLYREDTSYRPVKLIG